MRLPESDATNAAQCRLRISDGRLRVASRQSVDGPELPVALNKSGRLRIR